MTTTPAAVTEVDSDLQAMLADVFTAHRDALAEAPRTVTWDDDLWATLTELGLTRLTGSDDAGGSGAGWTEAAELLRAAAAAGVPTPYVEHDLLAGWLLETAGLPVDDARRTAAVVDADGVAHGVGWADSADKIVVVHRSGDGWTVSDVDCSNIRVTAGVNRAGEPRARIVVDTSTLAGTPVDAAIPDLFRLRGALARGIQVSGALESILRLSVEHTTARVQFGRPLSRFQAVQNAVSDIAAEAALARTVTEGAVVEAVASSWGGSTAFKVAVARSCVGHAASVAVRAGHQVHGAIGTTREHRLHEFTRPALAWRSEFGSVSSWDRVVADAALGAGPDGLWALITS
ncbi:acyl-CoA dehydrogenase [Gordonia spumicola]|uniref:Acyl-CoA dehydrogenase n=1 Tax=Gordonia spumicola TaxID=589161 RepID=A0A7I9V8U5_9ACTN|nr:acyl-CoA dehydrogenase family protein [Gordonia spumicola]GEE01652.1 acyl-CoA dehydrogenase [Gordonia spumicola]GEE01808.1 acyl-CoA dehydrogenase [Gordonia spumicola]